MLDRPSCGEPAPVTAADHQLDDALGDDESDHEKEEELASRHG